MLSAISWAAVYFVMWWTTLFAVLPFGARGQSEVGEVPPGSEAAAPARPRLARLFLITTIIASLIFVAFYIVLTRQLIGLDDIPFLPKFEKVV